MLRPKVYIDHQYSTIPSHMALIYICIATICQNACLAYVRIDQHTDLTYHMFLLLQL